MEKLELTKVAENEEQEEDKQDHQHHSSFDSAFANVPPRPPLQGSSNKYSPLDWLSYFDQQEDICIPNTENVFHVYKAGTEGPVIFCLHGGGYAGLSFASSASKMKEKARVVAMDLRGHGKSLTDNDLDLSMETLCADVLDVLKTMYEESPPAVVLVGH
ncbi:hypothetical protein KSS87_018035, partial [Heliosperma pusillum]